MRNVGAKALMSALGDDGRWTQALQLHLEHSQGDRVGLNVALESTAKVAEWIQSLAPRQHTILTPSRSFGVAPKAKSDTCGCSMG